MNEECLNNQCRLDSHSTDWSICSQESLCTIGEGDCDEDAECEGSLLCGNNNCASGPKGMDCCAARYVSIVFVFIILLLYLQCTVQRMTYLLIHILILLDAQQPMIVQLDLFVMAISTFVASNQITLIIPFVLNMASFAK